MTHRFLITSAPGLERLLADELSALGIAAAVEPSGAVSAAGDWAVAARILTRSRIASRVTLSLRRFAARNKAMLYDQVRRVNWPEYFGPDKTLAVTAQGAIEGTDFVLSYAPLRIKDAVCDEFRKHGLDRPDVDRRDPEVLLNAHFHGGRCELSVDLCGAPLHRRGYREEGAAAPLRENRAAALLIYTGYDGSAPLTDPFCGSGTIPIEGALIATRTAPGLLRETGEFAAAALFSESRDPLEAERAAARRERLPAPPHPIRGCDISEEVLATARGNAAKAGVAGHVHFTAGDARSLEYPPGMVVANPPYGERLLDETEAAALVTEFVRRVKHHGVGSTLGLVLPRGRMERAVGLRPDRRLAVESGSLGLRYSVFTIYAGSRKSRT